MDSKNEVRRVSKQIHTVIKTGLLLASFIALTGCGKESQAKLMVENFNIVDTYDYDKIKVVVEEEKTPEQIAREIIQEEMGLNITPQDTYDEYGLSPQNGLFVNSAILEGPEIPSTPGFDKNLYIGQTGSNTVNDFLYVKYDELQQRRESVVAQNTESQQEKDIAEDIQKRLAEQEQTIYQQQELVKQQEELYPELFPKIEIQE